MRNPFDIQDEEEPRDPGPDPGPYLEVADGVESDDGNLLCEFDQRLRPSTRKLLAASWSLKEALRRLVSRVEEADLKGTRVPRSEIMEAIEVLYSTERDE